MTFTGIPFWASAAMIAGLAGLLGLLHLLRVRPREVRVITTLFWHHAVERTRARALLERFRHPWTYGLLLLLCALLALALGKPQRTVEPAERIWAAIVVDAGASMSAPRADRRETRFEAARRAVSNALGALSLDDRAAIVVADPWPRLVHRFEDPRPLASRRIAELTAADRPAATRAAVQLACSLLEGRANRRLVIVTDRSTQPEIAADSPQPIDVRVERIGDPADNAAILWAAFEPDAQNPLRGRVRVRLGYWGEQPRSITLDVRRAGGAPLLNESATVLPGETKDVVVSDLPADGDKLLAAITSDDAVAADNRVEIRLPLRTPIRVAMIAGPVSGTIRTDVPKALAALFEGNPAVHWVSEDREHDLDVIPVAAGTPAVPAKLPSLVVVGSGPAAPPGRVRIVGSSPLVWGLDFEAATSGTGPALDVDEVGGTALLAVDDAVLACVRTEAPAFADANRPATRPAAGVSPGAGAPPCVYVSSALFADDSAVVGRPAFAVFLARIVQHLAGWDEGPIVLSPERAIEDPLLASRAGWSPGVAVMPGSREAGNTATDHREPAGGAAETAGRWAAPAPCEMLLLAAFVLFLLEALLHVRGRIP